MRLAALTTWTALALFPGSPAQDLEARYEVGQVIVFEEEKSSSFETSAVSAAINGEELPDEALGEMGLSSSVESEVETMRTTTRFTSVEDGRLIGATRTFDVLEKTETRDDEDTDHESPLVGHTLVLTETDEDEVEAELEDEDADVDEIHLENHRLAYIAADYLPEGAVDVGDSWELDEDRLLRLIQIDSPTYYEPDAADSAFEEAMRENASGSAEVTYARDEDRDGIECAVLVVEFEMEVGVDDLTPEFFGEDPDSEGMTGTLEMTMEGKETVWFALEGGRPVASTVEIEGGMTIEMIFENPEMEMELIITVEADVEGESSSTWTLESDD